VSQKKPSILDGWSITPETHKDPSGNIVISELHIVANNEQQKNLGLSTAVLRAIKLNEILNDYLDEEEWIEIELLFWNDDFKEEFEKIRKSVAGTWPGTGNKSHPDWMYASVALLFYKCQRVDRNKPISLLAELLEVDVKTAARRVDKARQLGLLTRPTKGKKGAPAGKSGGMITEKCAEILKFRTPREKRKTK
jgi:hypothetical protein